MKGLLFKCLFWISFVHQNSTFVIIDDELESLFDVSYYNLSKVENSSATIANHTEDDISQLFELYDKVFNISESSVLDATVTDEENVPIEITGATQEQLRFNTSDIFDTLKTNEYQPNTTVIIEENEKKSKTDALLIESVEKIGDAEVQKEFIKEVETVQQSFGDDLSDEDSKKNVSVSPIDDLSGYVIEENDNTESFINYNALYEEKVMSGTTEQTLDSNQTVEELTLYPETNNKSEKEFNIRRIEQVLEARISSIIFGESFADEDISLNINETNIDDDLDSTDEIMIAMETNLEHGNQTWNITMSQNSTKLNLDETLEDENMEEITENIMIDTEPNIPEINERSTTETDVSTTKISDYTTESSEEVINITDKTEYNALSDSYTTEDKHNLSSVESNFSTDNLNRDSSVSQKTARGLTDFGIKNALSQEKHKLTDLLIDHTNTLNMTSVCMIILSILTLCLLCGVCLILIIQKFKLLRHNDSVAPA